MRNAKPFILSLTGLILTALLAACGSGSGSGSDAASPSGTVTQGIAVDPYIVGAIFQEVAPDGTLLQRQSTATDAAGRFGFPQPLTPGSVIGMKAGQTGRHVGMIYEGMLKRKVEAGDDGVVVVSPLTTLLANGIPPREVLDNLALAGLPGLTEADLTADPMEGLAGMTSGVTDDSLKRIRAAMAVNGFMFAIRNFDLDAQGLNTRSNFLVLENMVTAVKEILNPAVFDQISGSVGSATPDLPVTLGDVINMAATLNQNIARFVREDLLMHGTPMTQMQMMDLVRQNMTSAETIARSHYDARLSAIPVPTPDSGTGEVPPGPAVNAQAVYDTECAGCHKMGTFDPAGSAPDLAEKGALIAPKIQAGHMNRSLTSEQIAALAAWVDTGTSVGTPAPAPTTPDPTVPADGATLYATECAACHGDLANTDKPGRTAAQIQAAIAGNVGNMGYIVLTDAEAQAIADVLPAASTTPDPAPMSGQTIYDSNCAGCHAVNGYDASGSPDLAGAGSLVAGKLGAGHQGRTLTAEETAALAGFLDQYQAPVAGPDYSSCTACHGQPPDGTLFPNGAGSHAVHQTLPGVGTNCAVCHGGAAHNDWIDLGIASTYNAKTGAASYNPNGSVTCSNVSCHGGKTTPDWWGGTINVNTQCTDCHASGTTQYNSYNSSRHSRHSSYSCTVCHNTGTLAVNHFSRLDTAQMEGPASATIGGGSTSVGSYSASTKTCSNISCHSSKTW